MFPLCVPCTAKEKSQAQFTSKGKGFRPLTKNKDRPFIWAIADKPLTKIKGVDKILVRKKSKQERKGRKTIRSQKIENIIEL